MKFNFIFVLCLFAPSVFAAEPKILFEEDPTSLVSTIQIAVLSGANEDPMNRAGLTNLYTELMLRGNKKMDRAKFQSELERMGATFGAYAAHDRVIFSGKVIKENTFKFLKLIEESLLHPTFPKNEFEALRTEILNEVAHMKNSNNRLGGLMMRKVLFQGTPMERPISGSRSTLKAIQHVDVLRAYNNAFHQANIVFAIASPIPEAEWKKPLTDIWAQLPDGARLSRKIYTPKVPESPTLYVIHKAKTSTGALIFAQAGMTAQDPARYTLAAGNFTFGGEPLVSRLFRTIRGQLGWTYAIGSGYGALGSLSYQPGVYTISSTPSIEFATKTLFKTLSSWEEYMNDGLSSDEMALSQESMVNSYPFDFENAEKRLGEKMHSFIYGVPILNQEEYSKRIESISNSELKKQVALHHKARSWFIALVADKDVVEKQLVEEQKDIPEDKRLKITKVVSPDEVIE